MNVAFLFAGDIPWELAEVMVKSVRKSIPKAHVIQLTDPTTSQLPFVDEVRRKVAKDLIDARFAHQEDLPGDSIIIDYDCIVQKDITTVFAAPFDLAITRRPVGDKTASASVMAANPHNLGVIFQRSEGQPFWAMVRRFYSNFEGDGWIDGQALISKAIVDAKCHIIELPGEIYNYTPLTEDEDVSMRAVVHYKGLRKAWMFQDPEMRLKAKAAGKRVLDIMHGSARSWPGR